jgi:hypothetical protein
MTDPMNSKDNLCMFECGNRKFDIDNEIVSKRIFGKPF